LSEATYPFSSLGLLASLFQDGHVIPSASPGNFTENLRKEACSFYQVAKRLGLERYVKLSHHQKGQPAFESEAKFVGEQKQR
jgi:hypothetical protein